MSTAKVRVNALLDDKRLIPLVGRQAWAMKGLVEAGKAGVTPLYRPAPRWAVYVHALRQKGFAIETITEEHGGDYDGTHGRYVLRSDVKLSEFITPDKTMPANGQVRRASNSNSNRAGIGDLNEHIT